MTPTGRLPLVVAVVALVVTAGCAGLPGIGDGGDGDGTPRAIEGETEPPFSEERLPPGVSTDGAVDVERLTEAHAAALSDEAFTLDLNLTRQITANGSTTEVVAVQQARSDGEGEYITAFSQETPQFTLAQTTWGNQTVAVSRVDAAGSIRYRRADVGFVSGNLSGQQFAQQFLSVGEYSVAVAGDRRVVLTADSARPGLADELGQQVTAVDGYEGRVVVDSEGRIRQVEATIEITVQGGGEGVVSLTMSLSGLDATSVERPEWVPEALAETDEETG